MRKKRIIIIVIILILISAGVVFFMLPKQDKGFEKTNSTNPSNISENVQNNFDSSAIYSDSAEKFSGTITFREKQNFNTTYFEEDNNFVILILAKENENDARDEAEKDFLQTLKINEEEACKLDVYLTFPYNVNNELAGENYGLSFCPNGKSFF